MTEQTPSNGRAEPTQDELRHLCAISLERWTVELAARLGPDPAADLLLASAVSALEAAHGIQAAAERLRADADRLEGMLPHGHALLDGYTGVRYIEFQSRARRDADLAGQFPAGCRRLPGPAGRWFTARASDDVAPVWTPIAVGRSARADAVQTDRVPAGRWGRRTP